MNSTEPKKNQSDKKRITIQDKKRITIQIDAQLVERLAEYGIDKPAERSILFEAMLIDYLNELDAERDKIHRSEERRKNVTEFWKKATDLMLP